VPLVTTTGTQTLTNKTVTQPKIEVLRDSNNAAWFSTVPGSLSYISPNGNAAFQVGSVASAANFLRVSGVAAGSAPNISSGGTDTDVSFNLTTKGTGTVQANGIPVVTTTGAQALSNKTLTQPAIVDSLGNNVVGILQRANAVNYLQFRATEATGSPAIFAAGADTNVGFTFVPKGSGTVQIYTATESSSTIQATGAGTTIDLNLVSKGSGVVEANGVPVVTESGTQTLTSKPLTTRNIGTGFRDTGGAFFLTNNVTASAVNNFRISAAATGAAPTLSVEGTDTDVSASILPKGAGSLIVGPGTTTQSKITASGTNTDLSLLSKGTGSVLVNGNHAVNKNAAVPATPTSTGIVGQVAYDSTWFYVCTATNTWRRAALSTW